MRFIIGVIVLVLLFLVFTFPATWLLMLFFGNVGQTTWGYWDVFPLGILVSVLLAGVTSHSPTAVFLGEADSRV